MVQPNRFVQALLYLRSIAPQALIVSLYLLSIVAGVVAIDQLGVVQIPGGFAAPAAVYVVGVTLLLRDLVHEAIGRRGAFFAIVAAAALSAIFNPSLAVASGLAFLISETLDLLVYEKVRDLLDSRLSGMMISNAISIPVDSLIFLQLAFGSLVFLPGQIVGKSIATVVALAVLAAIGTVYHGRRERKLEEAIRAEYDRRSRLTPWERMIEDANRA